MYQQITIVGNVGNDPSQDQRFTPSGVAVTNLNVGVNRKWTNADGQAQEKTVWFKVTCWRGLAEVVGKYVTKGQQVLVIGEVEEPEVYTDKQGETRTALKVTAREVKFLGGRGDAQQGGQAAPGSGQAVDEDAPIPF